MTHIHESFSGRSEARGLKLILTYAGLLLFNAATWAWACYAFAQRPLLLGVSLLAYSFGLRHAFDADHIAAIDNIVRKLVQEKKRPETVGLHFSLGHSTVVIVASLLIAITAEGARGQIEKMHAAGGMIGAIVSACFLFTVAIANLIVLKGTWAAITRTRLGVPLDPDDLDRSPAGSGLMMRLLRRTFAVVSRPWHMYLVGFLFGLGFDTATEIGVLGISAAQGTNQASVWIILIFPMLFTAGMSLVDFTDSVLMTRAYGWAAIHPLRKLWYNLTITATSVVVALLIGGLEALGFVGERLRLTGGLWGLIARQNQQLGLLGIGIVGFFAIAWLASYTALRWRDRSQVALVSASH